MPAILQLLISSLLFALLGYFVQKSYAVFPVLQIAFARAIINLMIALSMLKFQNINITQQKGKGLWLRSVAGLFSMVLYFKSLAVLPLADAVVINYSVPLMVGLILFLFARPRPQLLTLLLSLLGFFGVVIIVKPTGAFLNPSAIWGFLSLICATIAFVTLHEIAGKYSPEVIITYFTGLSAFALLPFSYQFVWPTTWQPWIWLIGVGIIASIAQAFLTRGYKGVSLVVGSQMQQTAIIFGAIFDIVFHNRQLDEKFYFGSLLVIISCVFLVPLNREIMNKWRWQTTS